MTTNPEPNGTVEARESSCAKVPRHVAFIMDGNGRWAATRGLPRTEGHRKGLEALRRTIRHAGKRGVEVITIFSFSSENWSRPEKEVSFLMGLLRRFVQRDLTELHEANVWLRVIGERSNLDTGILKLLIDAENLTKDNSGLELVVAFNYGSRQEIVSAVKTLNKKVVSGELAVEDINEDVVSRTLYTSELPDPDLIIRTSGEMRLSNFLLWQAAYTEFYFSNVYWPDFDEAALDEAFASFGNRDRRFGGLSSSVV